MTIYANAIIIDAKRLNAALFSDNNAIRVISHLKIMHVKTQK